MTARTAAAAVVGLAALIAFGGCGSDRREDAVSDKQWTEYERNARVFVTTDPPESPKVQVDDRRR